MSFGHVIIKENGVKCNCGNCGCFESYASMRVFKEKIANKMKLKNASGKEIYEIIKENNNDVEEIVNEYVKDLSIGITNYINIFEPEAICLGGGFVHYKDILLPRIINELKTNNMTYNKEVPEFVIAKMRKLCRINWCCRNLTTIVNFL